MGKIACILGVKIFNLFIKSSIILLSNKGIRSEFQFYPCAMGLHVSNGGR